MIVVAAAQRRAAGCTVTFLSRGESVVYGDGNFIFQTVGGRGGSIRFGRGAHFGQAWWWVM